MCLLEFNGTILISSHCFYSRAVRNGKAQVAILPNLILVNFKVLTLLDIRSRLYYCFFWILKRCLCEVRRGSDYLTKLYLYVHSSLQKSPVFSHFF